MLTYSDLEKNPQFLKDLTPMMEHYIATKRENPTCILFYRLGDFYEMFFDDAISVSRELELTLTGKACGLPERAPMCGVPYHAVESYLNRLVQKGYKVAICDQLEDPREAKGMVKRGVTRIVTPGTNMNASSLEEGKNNYILSIIYVGNTFGLSAADVSTGDFFVTELDSDRKLMDELSKYHPSELVCNDSMSMCGLDLDALRDRFHMAISPLESYYFEDEACLNLLREHFHVSDLTALGLKDFPIGSIAAGALLKYLIETQKSDLANMSAISPYRGGNYMLLDAATRRNLELVETLREKEKRGSLLWVLDKTRTAMGARMLRSRIEQPLIDEEEIINRYDALDEMLSDMISREEIREYLNPVYDLERLITRITYQTANPRDLVAFASSVAVLPAIRALLADFSSRNMKRILDDMDPLEDIKTLISSAIAEEPPISSHEGGIIRAGYNQEIDRLRAAATDGKQWLAELETKEREKTGIKNLRIKYNRVFGYYLEVTNSYLNLVPDYFIRKQTLTNAERFYTPELKELENTILGSADRLLALENELFCQVRDRVGKEVVRIQKTARAIASLDFYQSLAKVAEDNRFCRPRLNKRGILEIKNGRHPVVEKMLRDGDFIANDTYLDNKSHRLSIITGPNMAGKSTYMRQNAIIVLMAQVGSFVPAEAANISVVDRIFTRVGASDDLASGQSTFMVEMSEVANILRNATSKSLLILDEIGRGTSTFDGLSIAWAMVEYIANSRLIGAKTLFATHYHELTELEGRIDGVNNYCVAVKEKGDEIVFLRKIVPGGADRSYGIQVAKLAGVPDGVIERAKEISEELSDHDITLIAANILPDAKRGARKPPSSLDEVDMGQMSLFDTIKDDDIIRELRDMDISNLTPLEALNRLNEMQNKVKNRW